MGNRPTPLTSGIGVCKTRHEQGISSSHGSPARGDYVPALCTHRPSLLPIGPDDEDHGALARGRTPLDEEYHYYQTDLRCILLIWVFTKKSLHK